MNDLRIAIEAFIEERDWEQFHSPKNLAMALSVEVAGEIKARNPFRVLSQS
jgi:hypothetical protein